MTKSSIETRIACEADPRAAALSVRVRDAVWSAAMNHGGLAEVDEWYGEHLQLASIAFNAGRMSVVSDLRRSYCAATDEHATARDIALQIEGGHDL